MLANRMTMAASGGSVEATDGSFSLTNNQSYALGSGTADYGGIRFAASVGGTVTSVRAEINTLNASFNSVIQFYTDNAGSPGTQVGGDSSTLNLTTTGVKTWTWASNDPVLTAATDYWCILKDTDNGAGDARMSAQAPASGSFLSGRNNTVTSIVNDAANDRTMRFEINTLS